MSSVGSSRYWAFSFNNTAKRCHLVFLFPVMGKNIVTRATDVLRTTVTELIITKSTVLEQHWVPRPQDINFHSILLFYSTKHGCEACLLRAAQEEHFVGSSSSGFLSHRAQQWCPQEQNRSSVPPPPPPLIQLLLQCLRCSFTVPAGSY